MNLKLTVKDVNEANELIELVSRNCIHKVAAPIIDRWRADIEVQTAPPTPPPPMDPPA